MKIAVRIVIGVAVVLALYGLYLYDASGQFRAIEPLSPGPCEPVPGAVGAEDIETDRSFGVALISSDDRAGSPGALFAYDLRSQNAAVVELPVALTEDLHPHGISLVEDVDGSTLFVVNHAASGDAVEIFSWRPDGAGAGELLHRQTVRGRELISPNDVAGVDDIRFYATNDHGSRSALGRLSEDYLRRKAANVVYYDGERLRTVARDIGYANGIALSREGDEVYVASTTTGKLLVYDRDPESGDLSFYKAIATGTGLDNIEVDRHGKLWVAAHPHLLSFVRHAADHRRRSPSEVLWIDPEEIAEPAVRPVWRSLGDDLSGSSVAVPFGSRILIGSVFEPHFLVCRRTG